MLLSTNNSSKTEIPRLGKDCKPESIPGGADTSKGWGGALHRCGRFSASQVASTSLTWKKPLPKHPKGHPVFQARGQTSKSKRSGMRRLLAPGSVAVPCCSVCKTGYPETTQPRARAKEKQGHSILSKDNCCKSTKAENYAIKRTHSQSAAATDACTKMTNPLWISAAAQGGVVRTVLDDWEPPDLSEFEA